MADFGLLGALAGKDNWQEKENNRRQELSYLAASNAIKEQKIAENEKVQQTMADYYAAINKLQVLPKGLERIKEQVSNPLKGQIANSIKEAGGDLEKWFKSGAGPVALDNYLSSIQGHPITQRELLNASHVAQWQADEKAGLHERMNFDPATGAPVNTMQEQLHHYNNGDTDAIDYKGAFKPGKFDEGFFGKTYGSTNRYQPKEVSVEDYAATAQRHLQDQGLTAEDARQQAMGMTYNYAQHLRSKGTPLQWKSDKFTANEQLAAFKLAKLRSMGDSASGISYLAGIHDNLIPADVASPDQKVRYYKPATPDLHSMVQAVGNEINEKTGGIKSITALAARGGLFTADFQPLENFDGLTDKDVNAIPVGVIHKDGRDYIQYKVNATDDALREIKQSGKPIEGGWFSSNQKVAGAKVQSTNWHGGHKMEFDMLQEIPFNPSTIAQQGLTAHEFSKTGQMAEGIGNYYSKMQQMSSDLLQGDEGVTEEPTE